MNTLIKILITAAALSTPLTLNAAPTGHYRWVDENGAVQYADRPPTGVKAEFIKFASTGSSKSTADSEAADTEGNGEKTASLPDALEIMPEKDPALCSQAQSNLKALDSPRIRITEADGTKRFITEEEKEDQRANARKFIEINC